MKEYDKKYIGYVGIDESGRGTIAGNMYFVGARLKEGFNPEDIEYAIDSKKTNKKQRAELFNKLVNNVDYCLVSSSAEDIDNKGLSACSKSSLETIIEYFKGSKFIYDGNTTYKTSVETLVKADDKVSLVSVASIIAKYYKDLEMENLHELHPEYNFIKNSGYGTKEHIDKIREFGYTRYHRKSFNIKGL